MHNERANAIEKKQGRGVGQKVPGIRFCCCGESGQGRPHPQVRDLEKRGGHAGAGEKNGPHGGSLRQKHFLGLRNSQRPVRPDRVNKDRSRDQSQGSLGPLRPLEGLWLSL